MKTYKGFDSKFKCRDFSFKVGEKYVHEGDVEICTSGFHSCMNPLDVFTYYPPATSRFAAIKASGKISKETNGDTKIASGKVLIKAEIGLPEMVSEAIKYILSNVKKTRKKSAHNTGYQSAASNTGNHSAASNTGNHSAASNTGNQSAASNTGNHSAASNTGYYSAASNTGYQSAASNTGNHSAASNTGNHSAASNTGNQSAASNTGNHSAASNTGYYSAASNTGYQSAASVEGEESVAIATGFEGRAKACAGSAIVLCERDMYYKIICIKSAIAGSKRGMVKPDVWYTLEGGKFKEVNNDQ